MNILIPHSWLMEQVKTKADPKKIQEYLSLSGPSVERLEKHGREWVYDIEVTTNRVDSMSVRGIAREAAVILEQFDVPASLVKNSLSFASIKPTANKRLPLPKITDKNKLHSRVACIVLSDVKRAPTPEWMAERLQLTDANIHDAAIDITNYATHELGHPIHAFDYDRIMKMGGEIIITEAKKGEKFITLDGENYTAVGGEVVYKNPAGEIIDLPAIKGTANSSINNDTKNILLWFESIEPSKVRFASMTHAIRTVAAQLSEKGVDPHLAEPTFVKAVRLYQEICGAQIASDLFDSFPGKSSPKTVTVDLEKITAYLGIELPTNRVVSILEQLGCEVTTIRRTLKVTPPTFRQDLAIPVDIIEEIARIYGYHKLPSKLMPTRIPLTKPDGVNFAAENTIKHYLADVGWQEVYTYSMVSEELATASGHSVAGHARLLNPLTDDKVYLRRSLLPSLKEVINSNSQLDQLSVFELANVYHPQAQGLPKESLQLGMVSTLPLREVKGALAGLLKKMYLDSPTVIPKTTELHGNILAEGVQIGTIAVEESMTAIELDISSLLPLIKTHPSYQPLPKTASVIEQLTFTLPARKPIGPVLQTISQLDKRIKDVRLEDIYQHNHTVTIEYWDAGNNLAAEDVRPIRKKIVTTVQKEHQAQLVGEVQ